MVERLTSEKKVQGSNFSRGCLRPLNIFFSGERHKSISLYTILFSLSLSHTYTHIHTHWHTFLDIFKKDKHGYADGVTAIGSKRDIAEPSLYPVRVRYIYFFINSYGKGMNPSLPCYRLLLNGRESRIISRVANQSNIRTTLNSKTYVDLARHIIYRQWKNFGNAGLSVCCLCDVYTAVGDQKWSILAVFGLELFNPHIPALIKFKHGSHGFVGDIFAILQFLTDIAILLACC